LRDEVTAALFRGIVTSTSEPSRYQLPISGKDSLYREVLRTAFCALTKQARRIALNVATSSTKEAQKTYTSLKR
jgi:hypothetical protein